MKTTRLTKSSCAACGKHVVIVGCGNIGSFGLPLVVRMAGVSKITLVDFDRYEEKNSSSQNVTPADFGKPKARVLARLARRLNPRLQVVPIVARLESVPLGLLRGDVLLACLDSKEARLYANQVAWRLEMPLVDAGVEASASLARVNVYLSAPNQPCLECAWDQSDYAQLRVIHPCDANDASAHATGAPACLGSLAASLQAMECKKIIAGDFGSAGKQFLIEAATQKYFVTTFRKNPNCRFNHQVWNISKSHAPLLDQPVGAVLKSAGRQAGLGFAGMHLARQIACPGCGFARRVFRLAPRLSPREKTCPRCGRELLANGFHSLRRLSTNDLDCAIAKRSLFSLGLRAGDIISLGRNGKEKFVELAGARPMRNKPQKQINRRLA